MWSEEERSQSVHIIWITPLDHGGGATEALDRDEKRGSTGWRENTEIYLEYIKIEMHLIHPTGM